MATESENHLPPKELLALLADGELHSGQELAGVLGVSRTAVWKQLGKFELLGMELQSQAGKGYRLVGGLELLSEQQILDGVFPEVRFSIEALEVLKTIDSTNAYLLREESQRGITVCLAESQTAGRGRRGRVWVSPFAKNIYLSLKMTVDSGLGALEGLSLAVGVVINRTLISLGVTNTQLKWPNDVLWCGRKLGGILIDVTGDPSGSCQVVVGIGINVAASKAMQDSIDQPWVSLSEILEYCPSRNLVVIALLNQLVPLLSSYESHGFGKYHAEWESFNAHAEREVTVHLGTSSVMGKVLGVTETGALKIYTDNGEQIFHGGEVSLRVAE